MNRVIVCNTRNLSSTMTGVQRYTTEILSRLGGDVERLSPLGRHQGLIGHAWEQFVLPVKTKHKLLWSPCNTGPLSVANQVLSIMDVAPLDHPEWSSRKFASWYRYLIPRLAKKVQNIITISEVSKQRILHHCPDASSKIAVTPLAADQRFKPTESAAIDKMADELKLPSRNYVVALGSLEPRKNLPRLLRVWKKIQSELPEDIWLVLAGAEGASLVFRKERYDHIPPRVFLTGHVPDHHLPALYSGSLASIYLSYYEGFGLPPLEAMSCGAPVIVANAASLPEVVGSAGLLVDPYDDDAIANGLMSLLDDSILRRDLAERGLKQAMSFSWDQTAEKTKRILETASKV